MVLIHVVSKRVRKRFALLKMWREFVIRFRWKCARIKNMSTDHDGAINLGVLGPLFTPELKQVL